MEENKKSILLKRADFSQNIINQINNSSLPLYLVEYILRDILNEIHIKNQQDYDRDLKDYQDCLQQKSQQTINENC